MTAINGTTNDDTLKGGIGNDIITGGLGNDLAWMGGGNDVFIWNAGHGNDTIEGQAGFDTLRLFGDFKDEAIELSANGARTKVHRDVGDFTLDLNDVERIDIRAREGSDTIRIYDLTGTDVKQVAIDLAGAVPGTGDGMPDMVEGYGTNGNDTMTAAVAGGKVVVTGLPAQLTISNADLVTGWDMLGLNGGKGNDIINASQLGIMRFVADGGDGNDRITGSKGNDTLYGGEGNDFIVGGRGNDDVYLALGDDLFAWYVGDGKDAVDGGDGTDTARLTGSNASEVFSISADLGEMLATRNGAAILQTIGVERLQIRALGGADRIDVSDLTGSNVRQVAVDLAEKAGSTLADADVDTVQVFGTVSDDLIDVAWSGSSVRVTGLTAKVDIAHAGATDLLRVYGDSGNDMIIAGGVPTGKMRLQLFGDAGDDRIWGSAGNDTVIGGAGNDLAFLGAGNDQFVWMVGDGTDKVDGQAGIDTLVSKGTSGADNFQLYGSDGQAVCSHGSDTVTSNDVERFQISTYGGGDFVSIDQYTLANTGLTQVAVDLGLGGVGDGEEDGISVQSTDGNDQITIAMAGSVISVTGLPVQVTVAHAETQDHLAITGLEGDDVINAASMPASTMELKLDGHGGNDTVTGGAGNDTLTGSDGNDVLRGGAGADYLRGDIGNDNLAGGAGADTLEGSDGNDVIVGGRGNDDLTGGAGSDTFRYTSVLDGHDVIQDFDGDPTGGQDTFNLDALFDALGIANGARAGRVNITDNGGTVDIFVNADGKAGNGFELHVATLNTVDQITIGQDVILS